MTGIRDRTFAELDTATLYAVLRLRSEVFGVEQDCVYADPDGRDNEPGTRHVFIDDVAGIDGPAAYLRVLVELDGCHRIGRVVTGPAARGRGLATELLRHVHGTTPGRLVLDAQTYLEDWYLTLGYTRTGPDFDEDGIPHLPMERNG